MENMHLEVLGEGVGVYVSPLNGFSADALFLADFAEPKKNDIAIDLCTGCAIIPMLWCKKEYPKVIVGAELMPDACILSRRSAEEFSGGRVEILNWDIRTTNKELKPESFTLVTCNPPYFKKGTGKVSLDDKKISRHESECTIEDVTAAAAQLLKFGGRLCLCHRPERLADVFEAMRNAKIEPKRIRMVAAGKDDKPWLVLVEGRKRGGKGLFVMPTLYINE